MNQSYTSEQQYISLLNNMKNMRLRRLIFFLFYCLLFSVKSVLGQRTQIRGFVDVSSSYINNKVNFTLGEQDLFITSELNDRFSFLGESVFKYSVDSPTLFNVSVERVVLKYNYAGNHNILVGKHHTPVNYWNDTYHHGRVFFPTIDRPLVFSQNIIPLHTTGVSLQGQNLGQLRFGYDLMVGNGIGSGDLEDNDRFKSLTAAVHIKPVDNVRLGLSYYYDIISAGVIPHVHSGTIHMTKGNIKQNLLTASVAYFGKKYELLAETTLAKADSDSTGKQTTIASYVYAGLRVTEKLIPYVRVDNITYKDKEVLFQQDNKQSYIGGLRYEINYLTVLKLEYQQQISQLTQSSNQIKLQLAIGF